MKKITAILMATTFVLFSGSVNAQTGLVSIEKVQALLDKAVGKTLGKTEKITKQVITIDSYTFGFTDSGEDGSEEVEKNTNIQWRKGFIYKSGKENEDLAWFAFKFNKKFTYNERLAGESEDEEETTFDIFKLYVLIKDVDEMIRLIKDK